MLLYVSDVQNSTDHRVPTGGIEEPARGDRDGARQKSFKGMCSMSKTTRKSSRAKETTKGRQLNPNVKATTVYLLKPVHQSLFEIAQREGRTLSKQIDRALGEWLKGQVAE
jgi:hypothetical protein